MNPKEAKVPNIKDLVTSVFFLAFSLFGWFYLIPYTIKDPTFLAVTGSALGKDSKLFPRIAMLVVLAMSLCLLIHFIYSWLNYKKINTAYSLSYEVKHLFSEYWKYDNIVILTVGILVAYCIMINVLGFVVSSIALVVLINFMMGVRSWKGLILAPAVLVGIIYLLFTMLLYVEFPRGILF